MFNNKAIETSLKPNEILALGWYYPWGNYKELSQKELWSRKCILDLKDSNTLAINRALPVLKAVLETDVLVVAIPSSTAGKLSGVMNLIKFLGKTCPEMNGHDCLVRTRTIPKASSGGPRSVALHLETMAVNHPEKIKGKHIVLLDDVTTSGASFEAGRKKLLEAGAASVCCLALAKTYASDEARYPSSTPAQKLLHQDVAAVSSDLKTNLQVFAEQQQYFNVAKQRTQASQRSVFATLNPNTLPAAAPRAEFSL